MKPIKVELQSRNAEAFLVTAQTLHFARAAEMLCITPSALSQRISALEAQVQSKLFIRFATTVSLTDPGLRLLRYCQQVQSLQDELLRDLGCDSGLGGAVVIAGFSTVARSVLMPSLIALRRQHPELNVEFRVVDVYELREILLRGQADFIVTQEPMDRPGYHNILLGQESNVLIEATEGPRNDDVYFDHNQSDDFTERFLVRYAGPLKEPLRRRFCDDIYGMLDGVCAGLGRGVIPVHLLGPGVPVHMVPGFDKAWATPVYLQYPIKDYYSAPIEAVRDTLVANCDGFLSQNQCGFQFDTLN
jgi:DNA-binding transcriptional LysR family regulator